ncbi:MAG: UDP-N-acetylmuramate--L-alanine ligase, partial [Methylococcales bacterium]|nr:UDP-N-acetylmuramate--L-alanine ligase [Methylococcales bacterium]
VHEPLDVTLNMPGWHNMLNTLAAIAIATHLGVKNQAIIDSLGAFKGIGRRFQLQGDVAVKEGSITLVDDYGHHPREVAATMEALRQAWPDRRAVVVFQPHRYTRTRDLFEDFVEVLSKADILILLDIYSAGEMVIATADGQTLCGAIRSRGQVDPVFVKHTEDLYPILKGVLKAGDVVLTLGAGNVGQIASTLPEKLASLLNS